MRFARFAGATLPFLVLGSVSVLLRAALPGQPGPLPPDAEAYLRHAGFTASELAALAGGEVIARVDSASDPTEVLAIGAVKVRTAREQTTRYYGQMISYVDGQVTLAFGRFHTPPELEDVKDLTLDPREMDAVRSCKPGSCDVRIGGTAIETFRRSIDWTAPDASARAQAAVRQAAVDYVAAYMQRGDDALVTYGDTSKPVSLKEQWRSIVANSNQLEQYAPALRDYLVQYPRTQLTGARDVFYWVKEDYGLKPVISVVHGVIYAAPNHPDRTLVVQKQIYASHYYNASLALATLIDGTENGKPITLIVYVNRSRGDALKGGFGGLKRSVARNQARTATQQTLATIQTQLEKAAGLRPAE